ncbi:hypothetical protein HBI56_086010 [Parastagonospora nodorum]|nr:hypothetical protein HBH53_069220 [Parastagonospora nodorum]KAH3979428.1 hypothetical protein HBH52_096980 [Parastagonospora nodorum]KAH3999807.1 hypothetical protein HBI10_116400 [Parastagonospora nodorum]KAH4013312.1 hypothetical protein HBI13_182460 [Parastagonospora nodorum]KAH4035386.1 hypothetical protein HBI09_098980 [Parastagonospora nodorum]
MAPGIDIQVHQAEDAALALTNSRAKQPSLNITSVLSTPTTPDSETLTSTTLVLNPAFITQEFDLLRFHAAAFDQLPKTNGDGGTQTPSTTSPAYSTLLISSPYNNPGHYLDLANVTTPSLLFAKALTALAPTSSDYATAPYTEALNFDRVFDLLQDLSIESGFSYPETEFYVVVFESKLKAGIDQEWLYKLDYESHREACESGGLLKYWFGKADGERRNLATCFWHSRADAYQGGLGPWHKKARAAGRELYESIVFSTLKLTVLEGAKGYRFEKWVE